MQFSGHTAVNYFARSFRYSQDDCLHTDLAPLNCCWIVLTKSAAFPMSTVVDCNIFEIAWVLPSKSVIKVSIATNHASMLKESDRASNAWLFFTPDSSSFNKRIMAGNLSCRVLLAAYLHVHLVSLSFCSSFGCSPGYISLWIESHKSWTNDPEANTYNLSSKTNY